MIFTDLEVLNKIVKVASGAQMYIAQQEALTNTCICLLQLEHLTSQPQGVWMLEKVGEKITSDTVAQYNTFRLFVVNIVLP